MKKINLALLTTCFLLSVTVTSNVQASEKRLYRGHQQEHRQHHRVQRHREHYRRHVVRERHQRRQYFRNHHRRYRQPVIVNYYDDGDYYPYRNPRYRQRNYYGPDVHLGYYGHINRNTAEVLAAGVIIGTLLDLDD